MNKFCLNVSLKSRYFLINCRILLCTNHIYYVVQIFFLYFEVHILSYPETQFGLELMGKMKNPLKRKLS